jgi:hypothetical protein
MLRIWRVRARSDEKDAASMELREPADEWSGRVAAFLLGEILEDALYKAAESGEPDKLAARRMGAYFHAGSRRMIEGRASDF